MYLIYLNRCVRSLKRHRTHRFIFVHLRWGPNFLERVYLNEFLSFCQSDCCVESIIFSRCLSISKLLNLDLKRLRNPPFFGHFVRKLKGSIFLERVYLDEYLSFSQSDCCVERIRVSRYLSLFESLISELKKAPNGLNSATDSHFAITSAIWYSLVVENTRSYRRNLIRLNNTIIRNNILLATLRYTKRRNLTIVEWHEIKCFCASQWVVMHHGSRFSSWDHEPKISSVKGQNRAK